MEFLYDDIPDTLSQLIRTAFVPREGMKFIVADFSAIEARVLSHLAKEEWRSEVFKNNGDIYCASASAMFGVPVEKHGVNAHLRQKGKIAELALGYGGSVGALTAMGALEMGLTEDELQPLVDSWRSANPNIVQFWWAVDRCVKKTIKERIDTETHGIHFYYKSGMLFIELPSGRRLSYVKPKMGVNKFGSESVVYEGIGGTKKWEQIESYGPKFVENIVQAMAGNTVRMSPVSMMMIHNPATVAFGDHAEMQKAIDMLAEVKESIINAYVIKTGLTRAKLSHLMDAETWMDANKAIELGFADDIITRAETKPNTDPEEEDEDDESTEEEKNKKLSDSMLFSRKTVNNALMNKLEKHYLVSNDTVTKQAEIPAPINNGTPAKDLKERLDFIKKFI